MFSSATIGNITLKNRIIRSATFEGMADNEGFITNNYINFYDKLSQQNIGALITGFFYVTKDGKAMQPGQAGIDSADKIPLLKKLTHTVHLNDSKIIIQIAHAGRQTLESVIGKKTVSSSNVRSIYFRQKPVALSIQQIEKIIEDFGDAALYAKQAGFDGVQVHAAHGYLIYQFITPSINKRKDVYGIDKESKIGTLFLEQIIDNIRTKCGNEFPILLKLSAQDDLYPGFNRAQFIHLVKKVNSLSVDGIEVSYGTMDYALNIFRGDVPIKLILAKNPIFKRGSMMGKFFFRTFIYPFFKYKLKPFTPCYNLDNAILAKEFTNKPVISVGGYRTKQDIESALDKKIEFISMSRPFICEPDFIEKLKHNPDHKSRCTNCNYCAIMCDTKEMTKCYTVNNN